MRILITGASKGIGAAIAAEVIKDATALILVARSKDLLSDVKEEIQGVVKAASECSDENELNSK